MWEARYGNEKAVLSLILINNGGYLEFYIDQRFGTRPTTTYYQL
jgi:hypothetical protein